MFCFPKGFEEQTAANSDRMHHRIRPPRTQLAPSVLKPGQSRRTWGRHPSPAPQSLNRLAKRLVPQGNPFVLRRSTSRGKPVGGSPPLPRQRPLLAPSAIRYPIRLALSSFQCDCLRDGTEAFALFRVGTARNPAECAGDGGNGQRRAFSHARFESSGAQTRWRRRRRYSGHTYTRHGPTEHPQHVALTKGKPALGGTPRLL